MSGPGRPVADLAGGLCADLDRPVVITGAAARVGVHGMGGIGKSVLANALVRDRWVREAFPDGIVPGSQREGAKGSGVVVAVV